MKSIKAEAKSPEVQRFHAIAADVSEPNYAEGVLADATAWSTDMLESFSVSSLEIHFGSCVRFL